MSTVSRLAGQPNYTLLGAYIDLLGSKKIEVCLNQAGMSANLSHLDAEGKITSIIKDLRLTGLPKEIARSRDGALLKKVIENSALFAEKDTDDTYNRVAVHVIGNGGGKSRIPFQEGLALGSVVKCDTFDKMEEYATAIAKKESYEEQLRGAEQQIEVLNTKIAARQSELTNPSKTLASATPSSSSTGGKKDTLITLWESRIENLRTFITDLGDKIIEKEGYLPIFEGFQQGLMSPIDMKTSSMEIQPRGFDTLNFNSQYFNLREDTANIRNEVTQSSSAGSASLSAGWAIWKAAVGHARSNAVADRVQEIQKKGKADGVWIANATVTTRHVRSFTKISYNNEVLSKIHDCMTSDDSALHKRFGISTYGNEKAIYLLTEAVLGGAFTAIVTFTDITKLNQEAKDRMEESSHTTSVGLGGGVKLFSVGGEATYARGSASKSEQETLNSLAQTLVKIELVSEGTIPIFTRNFLEREITKHLGLNPSKYEISQQDEVEAKQLIEGKETDRQIAAIKRQMKLQNAQVAILNTYRCLTSQKEQQNIHTMESVMAAYESFAQKITEDPECGVPVGFNYTVLTQSEIKKMLMSPAPEIPSTRENDEQLLVKKGKQPIDSK